MQQDRMQGTACGASWESEWDRADQKARAHQLPKEAQMASPQHGQSSLLVLRPLQNGLPDLHDHELPLIGLPPMLKLTRGTRRECLSPPTFTANDRV